MNSNSNDKKLLLAGLGIMILLLVIFNTYYYFASKKIPDSSSSKKATISNEVKNKLDAQIADFTKNVKKQEVEAREESKKLRDECRYTDTDPKIGAQHFENSELEGVESIDYFYMLKIVKAESLVIARNNLPCNYIKLSLSTKQKPKDILTINLPSGLIWDIRVSKVSPLMYKDQIGMYITMKLRIQKNESTNGSYKILDWQPIRSSIN
ncbi:hypothetical protein BH11PAT1_BH11PAT1_5450 [soil metagenome]